MAKTFITEDNLQNIANNLHLGNNAPSERAMSIQGNPVDPSINNQDKTVTPTESKQYITADAGYTGLGTVTVNAISSTYIGSNVAKKTAATIIPTTTNQEIPTNTYLTGKQTILGDTDLIADNIKSGVQIFGVTGSYVGEALNLQEKEISPNETQQEVVPDNNYNGLSKVTVNAISNTYVGSGITRRSSTDLTTSGATVTTPAGYYAEAASKSVATATQATPTVTIDKTTGVVTGSATQTAGYVAAGTKSGTLSLTTASGTTITPTESEQTAIAADRYTLGAIKVGAISSTYVGSDIATRDETDLSASGAVVTVPAGYYAEQETKSVATATQATPTVTINTTTGVVTGSATQTAGYVSAGTKTGTLSLSTVNGNTIAPTESEQTAVAADRYTLGAVKIGAISSTYIGSAIDIDPTPTASGAVVTIPTGYYSEDTTKSVATTTHPDPTVSINTTTGLITASHAQTAGYVSAGTTTKTSQLTTKTATTITPTESEQTAVNANVYTLGAVKVGAISSTYVGSGITQRDSNDLTASGATVTVPAGYYSAQATKSVTTMNLPTSASSSATSGYTSKATISRSTSDQYINIAPGYNNAGGYYKINAVANGSAGTPTASKGTVSNHSITITPSVTNTTGYITGGTINGTGVTVSADELVSGTKTINANGTNIDVANYEKVNVAVAAPTPSLQTITKTYNPTENVQTETVIASSGYDGIEQVDITVEAIPSTYIGSEIAQRSSSDLSANGATITAPAGYYAEAATKSVTSGSATGPTNLSGSSASISTGTNTLTLTKTGVTTTPTVSAGYISNATASTATVALTASVTTKAAATITPGTTNQTIASGTYLTGTQTISGDADLTAANIKQGTQIFGVTGSYTSDATAAASDIVSGQTAYVNGSKVTGDLIINKYYTGSTAPSSSLGSNGDIYFQS